MTKEEIEKIKAEAIREHEEALGKLIHDDFMRRHPPPTKKEMLKNRLIVFAVIGIYAVMSVLSALGVAYIVEKI